MNPSTKLRLLEAPAAQQAGTVTNPDAVVGERIKHIREQWKPAKLTQTRLIELLKAEGFELPSVVALSRIENGQRSLTTPQLVAVGKVLGVSVETLLTPLSEDRAVLEERLLYDLAGALGGLVVSLDNIYDVMEELAKAEVPVDPDDLLRFDVVIELRRSAHPSTRRTFADVFVNLVRYGLVSTKDKLKGKLTAAERRHDAQQVAALVQRLRELDLYEAPLPEHLIPTEDEA